MRGWLIGLVIGLVLSIAAIESASAGGGIQPGRRIEMLWVGQTFDQAKNAILSVGRQLKLSFTFNENRTSAGDGFCTIGGWWCVFDFSPAGGAPRTPGVVNQILTTNRNSDWGPFKIGKQFADEVDLFASLASYNIKDTRSQVSGDLRLAWSPSAGIGAILSKSLVVKQILVFKVK